MGKENCSTCAKESGELECEEGVPVMKVDDGGGSGGALATLELAQGRLGDVNLLHDKLVELLTNQERKKKGRRVLSFTGGDDGTSAAEEQRRRRCVQAMPRACERVYCRCEREVRKLELSLNRCEGRKKRE
jgi:hypothetical protein